MSLEIKTLLLVIIPVFLSIAIYFLFKQPQIENSTMKFEVEDWATFRKKLSENTQITIQEKLNFNDYGIRPTNWCEYLSYMDDSAWDVFLEEAFELYGESPNFPTVKDELNEKFELFNENRIRENDAKRECEAILNTER